MFTDPHILILHIRKSKLAFHNRVIVFFCHHVVCFGNYMHLLFPYFIEITNLLKKCRLYSIKGNNNEDENRNGTIAILCIFAAFSITVSLFCKYLPKQFMNASLFSVAGTENERICTNLYSHSYHYVWKFSQIAKYIILKIGKVISISKTEGRA